MNQFQSSFSDVHTHTHIHTHREEIHLETDTNSLIGLAMEIENWPHFRILFTAFQFRNFRDFIIVCLVFVFVF